MAAASTVEDAAPDGPVPGLSAEQWRSLARLCRRIERDETEAKQLFGPRALAAVHALREAQAARHRRRHDRRSGSRAAPTAVLAELADACGRWWSRQRDRPPTYYAPATSAIGPGLLLRLPELKAWLQQGFPLEAALPPDAVPEAAAVRAREVLVKHCLELCDSADGFHRRRHLLQMLSDHGHRQPLLRLVRRSAQDWAPRGWAENWEVLAGLDGDERSLAEIDRASAAAVPALQTWARQTAQTPAAPPDALDAAPACASTPTRAAAPPASARATPAIVRAWQTPSRVPWWTAAAAVLAVGIGLALHLLPRAGPAAARWVTFYDADGSTMAIDPESIRRDGRQLTYRVGVVRTRENSSAVAVFTTDCNTRQRRLETVQHYRGTRFETATLYEVRGASTSAWPPGGADVRLLQAACDRP